jgi:hypothetical protein
MTEHRRWFNVGVVKLPEAERDVARSVFAEHPERFRDVMGADTPEDHDRWPVGTHTAYSAHLTEREVEQFSRASNCRYVEPDGYTASPRALSPLLPRPNAQRYMQGEVAAYPSLTGTECIVAQIDEGTTAAARAEKSVNLVNRAIFMTDAEPTGEIWSPALNHGCLVMGNAVPFGGYLVDAFVIDANGGVQDSWVASAVTWVCTQGAQLVNMSLVLGSTASVVNDAMVAASNQDVVFFCAAGNENLRNARFPASANQYLTYVHSILSIDMSTDQKSSFSNYGPWHTGTAPGELVYTTDWNGIIGPWAGTSASTPHVLQLAARIMSTGVSARQAAAALKATVRDVGLGDGQGGGLYSMQAALRWLGKEPAVVITRQANPQRGAALPLW